MAFFAKFFINLQNKNTLLRIILLGMQPNKIVKKNRSESRKIEKFDIQYVMSQQPFAIRLYKAKIVLT